MNHTFRVLNGDGRMAELPFMESKRVIAVSQHRLLATEIEEDCWKKKNSRHIHFEN